MQWAFKTVFSYIYKDEGRWREAEKLYLQASELSKMLYGKEHHVTLSSIAELASTLSLTGRWKEAEKLYTQIMKIRKRTLGEEHPKVS
ncbi:hypothetical protein LZ31DRAFT_609896 [Colletotrichum somersetense]|nr:hypothetical protein LZ31DRAFT_609896 [Colletotrichum somersetense]